MTGQRVVVVVDIYEHFTIMNACIGVCPLPPRRPGPLPGPPTAATVHMEASSPDLPIALLAHTHTHSAEVAYICVPQSTGGVATLLKPVSGMTFGTVTMPVGVEILPDVL